MYSTSVSFFFFLNHYKTCFQSLAVPKFIARKNSLNSVFHHKNVLNYISLTIIVL